MFWNKSKNRYRDVTISVLSSCSGLESLGLNDSQCEAEARKYFDEFSNYFYMKYELARSGGRTLDWDEERMLKDLILPFNLIIDSVLTGAVVYNKNLLPQHMFYMYTYLAVAGLIIRLKNLGEIDVKLVQRFSEFNAIPMIGPDGNDIPLKEWSSLGFEDLQKSIAAGVRRNEDF